MTLSELDCNCNDCIFLVRDFCRYAEHFERHYDAYVMKFCNEYNSLIKSGTDEGLKEASKMKFQPPKKINAGYGFCLENKTNVDFIPATCQIHTQDCYVNRKYLTY